MQIILFGVTKDIVGKQVLDIATASVVNVKELKDYLITQYPALGELSSLAVAVNKQFAKDDTPIVASDELALIPPVSGG